MRRQRLDDRPIVDGEFGFGDESVPNALRQKRFDVPRGRRRCDGMTLARQPLPDGLQVGGVGAVHGDHQGFACGDDARRAGRRESRPCHSASDASPSCSRRSSPGQPSLCGASMPPATHDAPRSARAVDAHSPAVHGGATCDGQADDAAADDSK